MPHLGLLAWTRTRLVVGLALSTAVGFAVSAVISTPYGILFGWITGSIVVNVWTWIAIWPLDAATTRSHAIADDPGRRLHEVIAAVGSLAGLGSVGFLLVQRASDPRIEVVESALCFLAVGLAWFTIHTVFTVRYARLYYSPPDGGIDFNSEDPPQYTDFAYFAFTIGMSFAVSDNNVGKKEIRRTALQHALLSYLAGAIVIGATVNFLVSLGPG